MGRGPRGRAGVKLFVFGLGYSARHYLDSHADGFGTIVGTVRTPDTARAFDGARIAPLLFGPTAADPAIAAHLATTDALLVSVPPGQDGDPVLARYGAAIAASPIRSVVYLSTVGVYGDHGGAWIDETAPVVPGAERLSARIAAEAGWMALPGKQIAVLRLAGIYGPGRNALLNLKAGTARRLVKSGQVFNRIHVEDIARAIAAAFATQAHGVWNVADDEPAPPQDVVAYAATLMGIEPPPEQPFATATLSPMARSFYESNRRIANRRLKHDLGVTLAYPNYRAGLQALWSAGDGR